MYNQLLGQVEITKEEVQGLIRVSSYFEDKKSSEKKIKKLTQFQLNLLYGLVQFCLENNWYCISTDEAQFISSYRTVSTEFPRSLNALLWSNGINFDISSQEFRETWLLLQDFLNICTFIRKENSLPPYEIVNKELTQQEEIAIFKMKTIILSKIASFKRDNSWLVSYETVEGIKEVELENQMVELAKKLNIPFFFIVAMMSNTYSDKSLKSSCEFYDLPGFVFNPDAMEVLIQEVYFELFK